MPEAATDLLIVEDLLLLLLDDKTGTIAGEGTLMYTLGGAVLVELALGGHVEADEKPTLIHGERIHAVEGKPPTDPLLLAAYEKVAEKPRGVQTLLITIGSDLRGQVLERLIQRGSIRRESKKILGIFPSTNLPTMDPEHEAALLESVRAALVDGTEADTRTAALVALLSASGTLPQFHPAIRWSGDVYTRGKEYEAGNWGAAAVSTALARTAAAIAVSSTVAVTVATSATNN